MDDPRGLFSDPLLFDWDAGNAEKSWERHRVRGHECEEIFGQQPLLVSGDLAHSAGESRYLALGTTRMGRGLSVVFRIRAGRVRVISAREMSRRERRIYDQARREANAEADPEVP